MQYVFVVDAHKTPQTPIHPAAARRLLSTSQAAVWRRVPFTLMLKTLGAGPLFAVPCRLKIDPGAKTTGLAVLQGSTVLWAAELTHRGQRIKAALETRAAVRRSRRQRKTRYRPPRFRNRRRPGGWLPPSLASRVANIVTWTQRLRALCPLGAISQELVRFDTQMMQDATVSGVAYQQGTLAGYEVREYLLEKWGRECAYCHAHNVPLEVEHIVPKRRGGTDRISNLTLACHDCNERKGTQTAAEFGAPDIQAQARQPLKDAAAVNTTRWALYQQLCRLGLPVEVGTGGRTKYNRSRLTLPKRHWLDAACVGASTPETLRLATITPLQIKAMGHGKRQMCRTNKYGFPTAHRARHKRYFGFQTGDLVKGIRTKGKDSGTWIGRLTVRASGSFTLTTLAKQLHIHYQNCRRLWAQDGYQYSLKPGKPEKGEV